MKKYLRKFGKPNMVRSLKEMRSVLYDQRWNKKAKNFNVYYVWRGVNPVRKNKDFFYPTTLSKKGRELYLSLPKRMNFSNGVKWEGDLRYDITIIPPKMFGQEFPKTKGHKHLNNFQELITVLEGKALYLAQWGKDNKIKKIEVIKAKKGDWLKYLPNCDHLTINPGKKNLIMANWLSKKCKSDYSLFEKYQGAGYYYTKQGWIRNENYKSVPKLKFKKPLKRKPKGLNFLKGQ